jgi:hypothetical protein
MLNFKKSYLQINTADPQIFLWFGLRKWPSVCSKILKGINWGFNCRFRRLKLGSFYSNIFYDF